MAELYSRSEPNSRMRPIRCLPEINMKSAIRLSLSIFLLLAASVAAEDTAYVLGPDDQITVTLSDIKEIEFKPTRIDAEGNVRLNYAGTIHAAGLTTAQLATEIAHRLTEIVNNPRVTVEVNEYGSQPVSVLGAVTKPGVYQLRGRRTLYEVLSMAEGLRTDAGHSLKITREAAYGPLPLPGAASDGKFSTASVSISTILNATDPALNIAIRPRDVISVPRADMVYVVGNVRKPGGFVLGEKESVSVLQAVSLAEGLDRAAAPQSARILRAKNNTGPREEVLVNLKEILASRAPDQPLQANDILFIPNSATKNAALRSLEAGIQIATGVIIWRR